MMDTINERLSRFSSELRYEDIPAEVLDHLKRVMLDCYGCGLFGSTTPWMQIYRDVLENMSDREEASIWGTNRKTSVINAMMLNGSAINSFELDDTHTDGIIHVSTGVLGCITAFAEMLGNMSGKDFLTAAALAYGISCRVAAPVGMEIAHQGWNNTGTCCPFGSTAGVGNMLGLTPEQMGHAMASRGTGQEDSRQSSSPPWPRGSFRPSHLKGRSLEHSSHRKASRASRTYSRTSSEDSTTASLMTCTMWSAPAAISGPGGSLWASASNSTPPAAVNIPP